MARSKKPGKKSKNHSWFDEEDTKEKKDDRYEVEDDETEDFEKDDEDRSAYFDDGGDE